MKYLLLVIISIYQKFSASFIPRCRFYPSCSHYTYDAVDRYGVFKGGLLGIKRICRCHPFNDGGYDPVPNDNFEIRISKSEITGNLK